MADLADLVADALSSMPPDKAEAIAKHPDTPGAVEKIRAALGIGTKQDVMSTNEQKAAKDAGIDTIAHPDNSTQRSSTDTETAEERENRIRNQAISDMAVAASKGRESGTAKSSKQLELFEGLIDMGATEMKRIMGAGAAKLEEFSAAVKSAQSNSTKDNK